MVTHTRIDIPDAPAVPGLTFRHFRGESDYPAMVDVLDRCKESGELEQTNSVERIAHAYSHLANCNPYTDMVFAEIDGSVIGYSRVWWRTEGDTYVYSHFALLAPEWQGKRIRRCMLKFNECRARKIASREHENVLESHAGESETDWISLLLREHYEPVRYFFFMVRSLTDIPDLQLPEEFKTRPVLQEDCWAIWKAVGEALQDHWGGSTLTDEELTEWMEEPSFNPDLWQAAWDSSNLIAGAVLARIDEEENREYHRKRAYVGPVGVGRPYRRKGLARALITRCFKVLTGYGITEAALGVDTENPTGAVQLYESVGFSAVKKSTTYRKPMKFIENK